MAPDVVAFHPLARTDLFDLYTYIEKRAGPARAGGYIDRLEALCATLSALAERGIDRSDLGNGVRAIAHERRTLVLYRIEADLVLILRVFYGGRDFSADDILP